ncbi:MAG: MATE family efflux transporter [Firmicutes bacterium]|nr:MATE family efflux transporter [Bacillota bacterium]
MTDFSKANSMGEESISRLLWRFSLPATVAMAVTASYNAVDAAFVGRLGSEAIAALSVAFPAQMVFGALAIGTGVGAASLISRSLGAGKPEEARATVGQVVLLSLGFGILLTIVGRFFLEPMLLLFGATPEILPFCAEYMSVITDGALLLFLSFMLAHTIRAEGNAIFPMAVLITSSVVNIILDPIFIFVLKMEIRGAAIATILAKVVNIACYLWYYLSGRSALKISLRHLRPCSNIILEIYKIGLPTILIQISFNTSLIVANRILGSFGHIPIAVMGMVMRLQQFATMPVIGLNHGLLPIIGFNFGANKFTRIRDAVIKGLSVGIIFGTVAGLAFFLFPGLFLRIFTDEKMLLQEGAIALRIMVLMYPLIGVPLISGALFQGIGKGSPALLLALLRQFLLYIPLILLLLRPFGLTGIWVAAPLADFLTFLIALTMVSSELKRQGIPLYNGTPFFRRNRLSCRCASSPAQRHGEGD